MMIRSTRCRYHRYTLIEVIVAITLLVTVIGVLFLGTATVTSSWEQLNRHSQQLENVLLLDRSIDSLLSNIIPFTWPNDDFRRPPLSFRGDSERVDFTYIHAFNRLEDGAIRTCAMLLEDDEFVAYYCERPPFPESLSAEKLRRSVLSHDVDSVSFFYLDQEDEDVEFIDDWGDRDYLPLAILVHVEWNDGTEKNWLRRTGGSSYYERWGRWQQRDKE